jgi:hypothetical protein
MHLKCDPDAPCKICPKGDRLSLWSILGCRRRSLVSESVTVVLCPLPKVEPHQSPFWTRDHSSGQLSAANEYIKTFFVVRKKDIEALDSLYNSEDVPLSTMESISEVPLPQPWNSKTLFAPLREIYTFSADHNGSVRTCILSIIWELLQTNTSLLVLQIAPVDKIVTLLCSAAIHEGSIVVG